MSRSNESTLARLGRQLRNVITGEIGSTNRDYGPRRQERFLENERQILNEESVANSEDRLEQNTSGEENTSRRSARERQREQPSIPRAAMRTRRIRTLLHDRHSLRQAMLINEILAPPRGLRDRR